MSIKKFPRYVTEKTSSELITLNFYGVKSGIERYLNLALSRNSRFDPAAMNLALSRNSRFDPAANFIATMVISAPQLYRESRC